MEFLYLDEVPWRYSQAIYHAAAYLGREMLIVLRPATPYVCIGYHQSAGQEIDMEYANAHKIPVFRRMVGGGAVYLDGKQLFFQLIVRKGNPLVPASIEEFYRLLLAPVMETYRCFGVDAVYKPVNDLLTNGRKISGTGAALIENMMVLVGNFIQDFDYLTMTRVLQVPDEKFRDKVYKTMHENLTTMLRETGKIPDNDDLAREVRKFYEKIFGDLIETELDEALQQKADELLQWMDTPEWLFENDRRVSNKTAVKIAEGVYVEQKMLKSPGGLIRATLVTDHNTIQDVCLSGDFFFFPRWKLLELEDYLKGTKVDRSEIERKVEQFYRMQGVESPGVLPNHISAVLTQA